MTLKEMAFHMYPYWLTGIGVLTATYFSKFKSLLKIDLSAIAKFGKFLAIVTVWRAVLFKLPIPGVHEKLVDAAQNISIIPWPATLTVFWEDACHGLPLAILAALLVNKKVVSKIGSRGVKAIIGFATALVMLEFGLGHVYQGLLAALMLSFYIPYSIKLGKKYGFGTVMICHTLFDLTTIISIKLLAGL